MLLDFSVVNYRCFADEAVLDLTRSSLKTLTPRPGSSWEDETWRVAALYGANASGKSTLLDAVECLRDAVGGRRGLLHQPYLLDTEHATAPTSYTIGFTHADQRFRYSVKAHSWGVAREELWTAGPRWRRLFVRTQGPEDDSPVIDAGPTLRGATAEVRRITTVEDLFLAVALRYRHETLAPVARSLRAMHSIHHSDMERERWLRWIMRHLDNRPTQWSELSNAIAHAADLGITRVELEELELAPQLLENLRRLMGKDDKGETRIPEEMLRDFQRSLVFAHTGADGQEHRLPRLDPSLCIGCGACEHACPVTAERPEERERRNSCDLCEEKCEFGRRREMPPRALVVRAVNPQQKAVKKFEDKAVDPVGDADFPF